MNSVDCSGPNPLGLGERPTSPDSPGPDPGRISSGRRACGQRRKGHWEWPWKRRQQGLPQQGDLSLCGDLCHSAGGRGSVLTCRKSRGAGLSRLGPANRSSPPRLEVEGDSILLLWTYLEVTGEGWWVNEVTESSRDSSCVTREPPQPGTGRGHDGHVLPQLQGRGLDASLWPVTREGRRLGGQTGARRAVQAAQVSVRKEQGCPRRPLTIPAATVERPRAGGGRKGPAPG